MRKSDMVKALTYLSQVYRNLDLSEAVVEVWMDQCGHWSSAAMIGGVRLWVSRSKWPPAPNEINELLAELSIPVADRPSAADAWGMAVKAVSRCSAEACEKLPAIVRQAVREIGAWEIRTTTRPEALRAAFEKAYTARLSEAVKKRAAPPRLKLLTQSLGTRGIDAREVARIEA